ncbi:hypothetical protein [Streptomyces avermitilis]|uniref:hypothetical protein n=1 Tax=Streptomyces avermitilis TaxID=33903 RepID=UPI0037F138F4
MDEYGIMGRGKMVHKLQTPGASLTAVCGRETVTTVPNMRTRLLCKECDTVSKSLTEGNDSATMSPDVPTIEETTMPPRTRKKTETAPPAEDAAPERSAAEVTADIEAALTALETADSEEKIAGLEAQVRADLLALTANKRAPLSMRLTAGLAAARERLAKPATTVAVTTMTDWRDMEGANEVFNAGVKRIKEGIQLGAKAVDLFEQVANIIFEARLRIPYKGAPDLHAKSAAGRQISIDMFDEVKKGIDDTEVDLLAFHEQLRKGVKNKMPDVTVGWLRALDESSDREVFESTFPMIAESVDESVKPQQAIREWYKSELGIDLPTKTRAEVAAAARARKLELEAKVKAGKELEPAEVAELEGEKKPEPTPEERVNAVFGKTHLAAVNARSIVKDVSALDAKERKAKREQLEKDIEALKTLYAALI